MKQASSLYPAKLSKKRARFEKSRAILQRRKLPVGHPYYSLPIWTPYSFARLFGWLQGLRARRKKKQLARYLETFTK